MSKMAPVASRLKATPICRGVYSLWVKTSDELDMRKREYKHQFAIEKDFAGIERKCTNKQEVRIGIEIFNKQNAVDFKLQQSAFLFSIEWFTVT